MPIEIKELVIRAKIYDEGPGKKAATPFSKQIAKTWLAETLEEALDTWKEKRVER